MRHALSFDVEDYFQVSNFSDVVPFDTWDSRPSRLARNTELILEELSRASVRATFFVLGWCADRFPEVIRQISEQGHEIAAHSFDHRLVYTLTPEEFREDLRKTRRVLEEVTGRPILGYRAPSFSITPQSDWAVDVLLEEGFSFDSSVFPIRHHRYGNTESPRFPHRIERNGMGLVEFPLSTIRFLNQNFPVAGGGYFRLLPYGLIRRAYRALTREMRPAILYLHPWEFDPDQPRVEGVRWLARFRHTVNLDKTQTRLRRMLEEFEFGTVTEVLTDQGLLSETGERGS